MMATADQDITPDGGAGADDADAAIETPAAPSAPAAPGELVVEICGEQAAFACGPGEEPRLRRLAETIDRCGRTLLASGFESRNALSDPTFLLMTAMVVADELDEARRTASAASEASRDAEAQAAEAETAARDAQARAGEAGETARTRAERAEADLAEERARSAQLEADLAETRSRADAVAAELAAARAADPRSGDDAGRSRDAQSAAAREAFEKSFAEIVTKAAKRLEAAASRFEAR